MAALDEVSKRSVDAAARWALSRVWLRPWRFSELVTNISASTARYGRLVTRWERRELHWMDEPASAEKAVVGSQAIDIRAVDPWSDDEARLAERSSHVAACEACRGMATVACERCAATGRAPCRACDGSGRGYSTAKKRSIQCKSCRGTGSRRCEDCTKGWVPCPRCRGTGRLRRWIAVRSTRRTHVGVWPNDPALEAHEGLHEDSALAATWPGARMLEHHRSSGPLEVRSAGEVTQSLGIWSTREQAEPKLDPRSDRVLTQEITVFEAVSSRVEFELSGRSGFVTLLGADHAPTPDADARPLTSWRAWVLATLALSSIAALIARQLFIERGSYYFGDVLFVPWLVSLVTCVLGATVFVAAWRRRLRPGGVKGTADLPSRGGLALFTSGLLAGVALSALIRPSLSAAKDAVGQGRLVAAKREIEALERERKSDPEVIEAREALVLAEVSSIENRQAVARLESAMQRSGGPWTKLASERARLRVEWARGALARGDVLEAREESLRLEREAPSDRAASFLARDVETATTEAAERALSAGDMELVVRLLDLPGAPVSAAARTALLRAYPSVLSKCPATDGVCQIRALARISELDPSPTTKARLAEAKRLILARLDRVRPSVGRIPQVRDELNAAEKDCEAIRKLLGDETESAPVCNRLRERLAGLD